MTTRKDDHNKMCVDVNKYTLRQFFILVAGCLTSLNAGITVAFPSVLNPAITSSNGTFHATSDQASWIAASHGIAGILGFFIFSPIFQLVGRKYLNFSFGVIPLVGWIIFIFADSIPLLFAARLTQGLVMGGNYIAAITVAEYCDPKRRGYFMALKKISITFGSFACHTLALFMDWRQISIVSCIPLIISCVMMLFWPESPAFLAMKGRFDKCEKAFVWVNGNSDRAQKQLKELINSQSQRLSKKGNSTKDVPKKLIKQFLRKDFLKPLFIASILSLAIDASGRFFLLTYITEIIVDITGDNSFAMYCAVASDLLLMCALSLSCIVIKLFKRRTILFTLGSFAAGLMLLVSLALVVKTHFNIGTEVRWLVPSIVLLHAFVSHIGFIPVAFAIMAEIFPLEHRGLGCFAFGNVFTILYVLTLKLTPQLIETTGVSGTYAIFGLCVMVCLVILFFILSETKDKTLQQIEDEIKSDTHETVVLLDNTNGLHNKSGKRDDDNDVLHK